MLIFVLLLPHLPGAGSSDPEERLSSPREHEGSQPAALCSVLFHLTFVMSSLLDAFSLRGLQAALLDFTCMKHH